MMKQSTLIDQERLKIIKKPDAFKHTGQQIVDEVIAKTKKLEIEIGEGRTLDDRLLETIKEIALSSMEFAQGEREFFLNILKQLDLHILEDWSLIKFIRLAEKVNVKCTLLGKPQLTVVSTEKSRQQLTKQLRESYAQGEKTKLRNVFEDGIASQDINHVYVNLALVLKGNINYIDKKEKENTIGRESLQDDRMINLHEQIYGRKENFQLVQLFSPLNDVEVNSEETKIGINIPQRLLIEGWAGIGKTVLCQYLMVIWARDIHERDKRWWSDDTQVVLWIRLRNLANYDPKNCCLGEVVRRECFGVEDSKDLSCPSVIQIEADLEAMEDKGIFLLDGFDEVAEWYEEYTDNSHQTLTARSELLRHELLGERHNHRVVLTSRPGQVGKIEKLFHRKLETIGFKDQDIEQYVKTLFKNDLLRGEMLLSNMKNNTNLWGISHIPVNLALICLMWKERGKKEEKEKNMAILSALTMTALYSETVLWLLRRNWEKHPIWSEVDRELRRRRLEDFDIKFNSGEKLDEARIKKNARELTLEDFEVKLTSYSLKLKLLEELAWEAQSTAQHILLISGEHIIECLERHYKKKLNDDEHQEILTAIKTTGLLESQYNEQEKLVCENFYYFPHLTFQEYFAAKYWIRMFSTGDKKEKAISLFKKYKYNLRYQLIWCFVAGLLKNKQEILESFLDLIDANPKEIVDIHHNVMLLRCMNECQIKVKDKKRSEFLSYISNTMEIFFKNEKFHLFTYFSKFLMQCHYILKEKIILDKQCEMLKNVSTRSSTLKMLAYQKELPINLLNDVVTYLDNANHGIKEQAIAVLFQQSSLPNAIIKKICDCFVSIVQTENCLMFTMSSLISIRSDIAYKCYLSLLLKKEKEVHWRVTSILLFQQDLPNYIYEEIAFNLNYPDNHIQGNVVGILSQCKLLPRLVLDKIFEYIQLYMCEKEKFKSSPDLLKNCLKIMLCQISIPSEIVNEIIKLLDFPDKRVKASAIKIVSHHLSRPDQIFNIIKQALFDKEPEIRRAALEAIFHIENQKDSFLKDIISVIENDKADDVRDIAVNLLANKCKISDQILMDIVPLLEHKNSKVRAGVAEILISKRPLPNEIIDKILNLKDLTRCIHRVYLLEKCMIGKNSGEQINCEQIIDALKDDESYNQMIAIKILHCQTAIFNPILEEICLLLKSNNWMHIFAALKVLQNSIYFIDSLISLVIECLYHDKEVIRNMSLCLLKCKKLPDQLILTMISKYKECKESNIRGNIGKVLSQQDVPIIVLQEISYILYDEFKKYGAFEIIENIPLSKFIDPLCKASGHNLRKEILHALVVKILISQISMVKGENLNFCLDNQFILYFVNEEEMKQIEENIKIIHMELTKENPSKKVRQESIPAVFCEVDTDKSSDFGIVDNSNNQQNTSITTYSTENSYENTSLGEFNDTNNILFNEKSNVIYYSNIVKLVDSILYNQVQDDFDQENDKQQYLIDKISNQWFAYNKCPICRDDVEKVNDFISSIEIETNLIIENVTSDVQNALQNLLVYGGKLMIEQEHARGRQKKVLSRKINALSDFFSEIFRQENLTEALIREAYNQLERKDINRGTGLYRIHSFFNDNTYTDKKDKSRLVKSTMGELACNVMKAVKQLPMDDELENSIES